MKLLLLSVLVSLTALAADRPKVAPVEAASGPNDVLFTVKSSEGQQTAPAPEPGKALVYVVEQYDRPLGALGKPTVRVGVHGAWVGANRSTSHLFFSMAPGEHHLCADWQGVPNRIPGLYVSLAKLNAEAGQTYYFRARFTEHSLSLLTLDLKPVNSDEGQLLVSTTPLSQFSPKK